MSLVKQALHEGSAWALQSVGHSSFSLMTSLHFLLKAPFIRNCIFALFCTALPISTRARCALTIALMLQALKNEFLNAKEIIFKCRNIDMFLNTNTLSVWSYPWYWCLELSNRVSAHICLVHINIIQMKRKIPSSDILSHCSRSHNFSYVYCKAITICSIFKTADTHLCSSCQIELFLLMQWVMTRTHKCHLTAIKCSTLVIALQMNENRC